MVAAAGVQAGVDVETFDPLDQQSVLLACSSTSDNVTLTWPELRTSAQPTVRLFNAGGATVFVRFTNDDTAEAVAPDGQSPGDVAFPAGAIEVFPVRLADDSTAVIAAITASSTANLYISPGYGA